MLKNKRILLIVHDYWPTCYAGVETYAHHIAHELAKFNEITILCLEPYSKLVTKGKKKKGYVEKYPEGNVEIIKIHWDMLNLRRFSYTYNNKDLESIIYAQVIKLKPDFIHIQHLLGISINLISSLKRTTKIPIVLTLHDLWFQCPNIRHYRDNNECKCSVRHASIECTKDKYLNYQIRTYPQKFLELINRYLIKLKLHPIDGKYLNSIFEPINKFEYLIYSYRRTASFRNNYSFLDLIIAPSKFLFDAAERFGFDKGKLKLIRHGIVYNKKEKRNYHIKTRKKIIFGYASSQVEEKGFYLTIDTFIKLHRRYKNFEVHFYGQNTNDKKFMKYIKKFKKFSFLKNKGVFHPSKRDSIFRTFDVLLIPSLWNEIYGLIIDEANTLGIPVIGSNRGAIPERVEHMKNGMIFDPNIKGDYGKCIKMILNNPSLITEFSRNIILPKTMEEHANELKRVYSRLLTTKF